MQNSKSEKFCIQPTNSRPFKGVPLAKIPSNVLGNSQIQSVKQLQTKGFELNCQKNFIGDVKSSYRSTLYSRKDSLLLETRKNHLSTHRGGHRTKHPKRLLRNIKAIPTQNIKFIRKCQDLSSLALDCFKSSNK